MHNKKISIPTGRGQRQKPQSIRGSTKYGKTGNCSSYSLAETGLPESARRNLAKWANLGLSKQTWSSYKTAERMLLKCLKEKKKKLDLPVGQTDILTFVEWLRTERKVKAVTIESYLAGIRQMHTVRGIEPLEIRSNLVNQVLKGLKNKNARDNRTRQKPKILAMTTNIMLLLKELVRT